MGLATAWEETASPVLCSSWPVTGTAGVLA